MHYEAGFPLASSRSECRNVQIERIRDRNVLTGVYICLIHHREL